MKNQGVHEPYHFLVAKNESVHSTMLFLQYLVILFRLNYRLPFGGHV